MSLDFEAIKARAGAATPGPWEADGHEIFGQSGLWLGETLRTEMDNADFIAHARQDVDDLVAEVERLRVERTEFIDQLRSDEGLVTAKANAEKTTVSDHTRLHGKAAGIRLALSYLTAGDV